MYQLVIDTTQDHMIFACIDQDHQVHSYKVIEAIRRQSDIMIESLDTFLKDQAVSMSDINAVVCCIGPGSFVGVRVGLTFAKVLASQFKLPLYTFTSLESLKIAKDCIIAIDAKGKKQFVQVYTNNDVVVENGLYDAEQFKELVESLPSHELSTLDTFDINLYLAAVVELLKTRKPQVAIDLLEPVYLK